MSQERLPPELQSLLAAEKDAALPDGVRDRVAGRLAQTLGVTLAAAGASTAATSGAHAAQAATGGVKAIVGKSIAAKLLVAVAVGGLGAGGVAGTVALVRHHRAPPHATAQAPHPSAASPAPSARVTPPVASTPIAAGEPAPSLAAAGEPSSSAPVVAPRASIPPAVAHPSSAAAAASHATSATHVEPRQPRHSDLAAERALLAAARSAMQAADAARALAILDDHAHRFAHGQLAEERDALGVAALWLSGDHAAARRRADAFARRHPDSLFLPSVERAVTEPPGGAQ